MIDTDLYVVRLLGLPLAEYRTTQQHYDELFREFAIIALDRNQSDSVPARLLALIDDLTARFSGFTSGAGDEVQAAIERGDDSIDLEMTVPREAGDACRAFRELLAEADAFCDDGELLTLKPPAVAVAFREWYLDQFVRQAEGEQPVPWLAYARS